METRMNDEMWPIPDAAASGDQEPGWNPELHKERMKVWDERASSRNPTTESIGEASV